MPKWRVAAIGFEHKHMPRLLRMVEAHPNAEIVGICDPEIALLGPAIEEFHLLDTAVFSDIDQCLSRSKPDLLILCPSTGNHASFIERVAPYGIPVLLDKPLAASLADADRILGAMQGGRLAINWPLAWSASHITAKRFVGEGVIGTVQEVHYYGGNRGPLYYRGEPDRQIPVEEKNASWWYQTSSGGGSLLDYLGYGATLGTWFMDGALPIDVSAVTRASQGIEVDEQSVTFARYSDGVSVFETRWGTLSDPWDVQTQPKNGFVLVGSHGTIASYDYDTCVTVKTRDRPDIFEVPADTIEAPKRNAIEYVLDCLERNVWVEGLCSPELSRIGQQIIESAIESARQRRVVPLVS